MKSAPGAGCAANWTKSGQIYTPTDEITAKAAIIQYKGLGWLYMPSVQIVCGTPDGGVATLASQNVTLHLTATDDVPAGYQWIQLKRKAPPKQGLLFHSPSNNREWCLWAMCLISLMSQGRRRKHAG